MVVSRKEQSQEKKTRKRKVQDSARDQTDCPRCARGVEDAPRMISGDLWSCGRGREDREALHNNKRQAQGGRRRGRDDARKRSLENCRRESSVGALECGTRARVDDIVNRKVVEVLCGDAVMR